MGAIFLNHTPSGEEMGHVTGLMTLKSEWEEAGRPGDFNLYENARLAEMFGRIHFHPPARLKCAAQACTR